MMIECDIMKNNKGQALVEFIIVLPIFLLLIISVIDFGNIIFKKYSLENDLDTITDMYSKGDYINIDSYVSKRNIKISYEEEMEFININLSKNVKVASPMLNLVLGKTYEITTSKSVYKNE